MTREEAIKILEPGVKLPDFNHTADDVDEACRMAVAALRAQQAKLDRSRWEGCPDCKRQWGVLDDRTSRFEIRRKKFCGSCGRPLTEEAWAELERRIGETET